MLVFVDHPALSEPGEPVGAVHMILAVAELPAMLVHSGVQITVLVHTNNRLWWSFSCVVLVNTLTCKLSRVGMEAS